MSLFHGRSIRLESTDKLNRFCTLRDLEDFVLAAREAGFLGFHQVFINGPLEIKTETVQE